jgi:hypothetical protein
VIKALTAVATLALALSQPSCGTQNHEEVHAKVCLDTSLHTYKGIGDKNQAKRHPDTDCTKGVKGVHWMYFGGGIEVSAVGDDMAVTLGSTKEPSGSVVVIPDEGGTGNDVASK